MGNIAFFHPDIFFKIYPLYLLWHSSCQFSIWQWSTI